MLLLGQGEMDDLLELSLEEILNVEVSVASKSSEKAEDAPSSVTVFTQTDIQNMGITYLEELLNFVPGFQAARDVEQGTAMRISARGRSSALSESVLFLLNGQRLNDLYTGGVSILNRLIAVQNIKQVEIIRGPGSALYGSNAFLGVVNIVTKDKSNSIFTTVGEIGSRSLYINVASDINADLHIAGFLGAFSDEGYAYDEITDVFGATQITDDPRKGVDFLISAKYKNFTFNARHMDRSFENFLTFGAIADYTNDERTFQSATNLSYDHKFNEKMTATIIVGYSEDQWRTIALLIPANLEIETGFALSKAFTGGPLLKSYNANVNLDLTYQLSNSNNLVAGGSLEHAGIAEEKNLMTQNPITLEYQRGLREFSDALGFNQEKDRNIIGVYLQDKQQIGEHLSVTAGFRFDNYDDFGSSFNRGGAIIYSTPIQSKIKVMYRQAYRAPNFLELYDRNNPVDFGNPNLDAEKVRTIELTYVQNQAKFQATTTFFKNDIEDLIVLGASVEHADNPLGAPRFENVDETSSTSGIEFELKATPVNHFLFAGSFTHFLDNELLPVSTNFSSVIFNYSYGQYTVNLNGIYRQNMDLLPGQDDYMILNTCLGFKLTTGLQLQANIRNLTDKNFKTITTLFNDGVVNRGRTFIIGSDYDFK